MKSYKKLLVLSTTLVGLLLTGCGDKKSQAKSKAATSQEAGEQMPDTYPAVEADPDKANLTVKFVDENGTQTSSQTVAKGGKATKPATDPTKEGKTFLGYVDTLNGNQLYDFDQAVTVDVTLKPFFVDAGTHKSVFEAEYCGNLVTDNDGAGMDGATWSGGSNGVQSIQYYTTTAQCEEMGSYASNNAFVHYMYVTYNHLQFDIVSSKAETVTMFWRVSAEYYRNYQKLVVRDSEFKVNVNGVAMPYGEVTFRGIPNPKESGGKYLKFQDFLVSTTVNLQEGNNVIDLLAWNRNSIMGTLSATSPMVDCISFYSTAELTWPTARLENMEEI